jgi:Delta7-sterol 5-desaturase
VELLHSLSPIAATLAIVAANYALYFALAGGAYLWSERLLAAHHAGRRFNPQPRSKAQLQRELRSAMKVMLVPSLLSLLVFHVLEPRGVVRMYTRVAEYGWGWYALSVALLFLLHDTVNYWTHRTMHHPWLYKRLHAEHHASVYPTPFGAFASSLTEITLNSSGIVLGLCLMPTHESVLPIFTVFSVAFTVYGHLEYAVASEPRATLLGRLMGGGAHHAWHHRHVHGNYGMYTRLWDTLMGSDRGLLEAARRSSEGTPQLPKSTDTPASAGAAMSSPGTPASTMGTR